MPIFELTGQQLELLDEDMQVLRRNLVRVTQRHVFPQPSRRFDRWCDRWDYFENRSNVIDWILTVAGGAQLPRASTVNVLKRGRSRLEARLNLKGIATFYEEFPRWQRGAAHFANRMDQFETDFYNGGDRAVRVLEITRTASFITLAACATLMTAGAASGAAGAAATASSAASASTTSGAVVAGLARQAAVNFTIREMQNGATRLGRVLSGDPPSAIETENEIIESALIAAGGAGLSALLGILMAPMTNTATTTAARMIQRGNLAEGVAMETISGQLSGMVESTIRRFLGADERSFRRLIQETSSARNPRQRGQQIGERLMNNRAFRDQLGRNLERAASRR